MAVYCLWGKKEKNVVRKECADFKAFMAGIFQLIVMPTFQMHVS
jgi:hypothetical protein